MPLDLNRRAVPRLDLMLVDSRTWHSTIADFDELSQDQLASFAQAHGPYRTFEPVLFTSAGEIVGGALMIIRSMPLVGKLASTHWGPILRRHGPDAATLRAAMADAIAGEYGDRRRMMVSIWAPPLYDGSEETQAITHDRGYREGRSWPDPFIYVLDLAQDEDQMHKNLSGKWRSHLNKALKSELTFEVADGDSLPEMDRLYTEMLARKGFTDRTPYHTLNAIMQTEEPSLRPQLFFVRKGEAMLSGAVVFTAGMQAHYLYGASADAALPVNAGHFMQWNIARWLKANTRARWYNLGPTDGVPGLVTFKSGIAGKTAQPVPVPTSIDYAATPITSFAGRAMFKLRDSLRAHTALPKLGIKHAPRKAAR